MHQTNSFFLGVLTAAILLPSASFSQDPPAQQEPGQWVQLQRVFPRLRFDRPVDLRGAGDGSGRLFVTEQAGVVRVFAMEEHSHSTELPADDNVDPNRALPTSKVFLDIRDRISRRGNEEGLIGMAFHPNFKENGTFFVHYSSSVKDMTGIVSRFRISADDPDRADEDSEEVILEQSQPYRNHNGGSIEFGPDGFLYITLGDGGLANDPHGNGQDLSTWLGTILRIDVDRQDDGLAYAVPADNPFVNAPPLAGGKLARPEIWAFGLRNVWRFSFDRLTGDLWAGDVGQDKWDEINIVEKGGNYGWNRFEADSLFADATELVNGPHKAPVTAYGREWGISVTGGYVYRGQDFPGMQGAYFYGDYVSGNLWRVTRDEQGGLHNELVRRTGRSIASFGEDDRGELYVMSFDGGIYRIVPADAPENTFADWPTRLSETNLYASTAERKLAEHLIPYEVNSPFWADRAEKSRFFELPPGQSITYREQGSWEVPIGTTIVKNFQGPHLRDVRMLETRLIRRTQAGWEAATYVWDTNGKDATLHPEGQQFELYQRTPGARAWQVNSWHAPSASECSNCHVDASGYLLGLTTAQLNRAGADNDENQITRWAKAGLLHLPDDFELSAADQFCDPANEEADLATRSRVWLDVNCAMCHQPNGPGNANIDLRYSTPLGQTRLIDEPPAQGNLGIADALLVAPGNPERSLLLERVQTLGPGRMPNVGTNQVDPSAVELLRQWILEMGQR